MEAESTSSDIGFLPSLFFTSIAAGYSDTSDVKAMDFRTIELSGGSFQEATECKGRFKEVRSGARTSLGYALIASKRNGVGQSEIKDALQGYGGERT
jgi:hypothetical protein